MIHPENSEPKPDEQPINRLGVQPQGMPQDEKGLWISFAQGSKTALNSIYQRHVELLFNYGCQLCGEPELVKDCIQEVFVAVLRNQPNLGKVVSGRAYLLRSLQREIMRRRKREGVKVSHIPFEAVMSEEVRLIEEQFGLEQRQRVNKALQALPTKQREAILLYYYEGLSYEEIAEVMDMALVKSARKLVYKALDSIRHILRPGSETFIPFLLLIASIWCSHQL